MGTSKLAPRHSQEPRTSETTVVRVAGTLAVRVTAMSEGESRRTFARIDALAVLAMFALSFLLVGLHVDGYTKVSPVDELQHIDYLYQIPDHPDPDAKIGQEALHQQLCRGLDAPGFPPPKCQPGELDPNAFQESGYNTAAGYTPIYYALTRGIAEVIQVLTPADDLVTAGRLAGGVWLGLGVALLDAAGRLRGVARAPLVTVGAMVSASPAVVFPSSTIAPDATAIAMGAGLVLALSWWELRPTPARALLVVLLAAVAALVKTTFLGVVAAVALYLLFRWARGMRRPERSHRALLVGVVASVAALVATAAWSIYFASLPQIAEADLPDMATRFRIDTFNWVGLGESLLSLVQPLSSPWLIVGLPQLTLVSTGLISIVLTAGVVAAAVFGAAPEREQDLARATLVAAVLTAAGLVVLAYVTVDSYIPLPARYGMALVGPMAICTAACIRTRTSLAIMIAITVTVLALAVARLVGLP